MPQVQAHNTPEWEEIYELASDENLSNDDLFAALYARRVEVYGHDAHDLTDEELEVLEMWDEEAGGGVLPAYRAYVAQHTPNAGPKAVVSATVVSGEDSPEWREIWEAEVTLTQATLYTDKDRKRLSTRDDKYIGRKVKWRDICEGQPEKKAAFKNDQRKAWGLTRHVEGDKEGTCVVFANCLGNRRAKAVTSFCGIGIDADSGHLTFDEAVENARRRDVAFFAHTSHSHLTTETKLPRDAVVQYAGCSGDPALEEIQGYVRDKKGLAEPIIRSMKIKDPRRATPDGEMIVVSHDPIEKFRMVFPLAEGDLAIADIANTQVQAHKIYSAKVQGLADLIGVPTDPAAIDVSRIFFLPRHRKGAQYQTAIHRGRAISFFDIPEVQKVSEKKTYERRVDVITKDGTNVTELYNRYGKRWMLADMLDAAGWETTASVVNSGGKFHIRCPFADQHTDSADDGATFAMNAEDSATGFAVIKCMHGSCEHRKTVDFLAAILEAEDE